MGQTETDNRKNRSVMKVVNRLPVPTYRFLRVNEASLFVPCEAGPMKGLWADTELPAGVRMTMLAGQQEMAPSLREIKTGMGETLDEFLAQKEIPVTLLDVAENVHGETAVILPLRLQSSASHLAALAIHAGRNSRVSLILDIGSEADACAAARGFFGLQVRVFAEEGAEVALTRIFRMSQEMTWFGDLGGLCKEEATIRLTTLSLGGSKRTSESNAYLGACITLAGDRSAYVDQTGYYCAGQTRLDMNVVADQRGKNTKAEMVFRGVLTDHASKIWRGTLDFKNGSSGSVGDEQEDTLMLSPHVENDSVPVILCGEEDVDGRHGATIGQLSEEMLFYMRSRGYTDAQARRLIVQARLKSVTRQIPDERLRWEVEQWIEKEIA